MFFPFLLFPFKASFLEVEVSHLKTRKLSYTVGFVVTGPTIVITLTSLTEGNIILLDNSAVRQSQ